MPEKPYIVKRRRDSPSSVARYLQLYTEQHVHEAIQQLMPQLEPQYVIRVDGRTSASQMFQVCSLNRDSLRHGSLLSPLFSHFLILQFYRLFIYIINLQLILIITLY